MGLSLCADNKTTVGIVLHLDLTASRTTVKVIGQRTVQGHRLENNSHEETWSATHARSAKSRPEFETVNKLEYGTMPNVMAALPNIVGALCSTPQSLADAHY